MEPQSSASSAIPARNVKSFACSVIIDTSLSLTLRLVIYFFGSGGDTGPRPTVHPVFGLLGLRLRRGPRRWGRWYAAAEAEDVVRVVAVLERDQALPIVGRVGGPDPLGARVIQIQEVDVGGAGRERTHRLGHTSVVRPDPFGNLRRWGGPRPSASTRWQIQTLSVVSFVAAFVTHC